jgi:hypothetical protein
MVRETKKRRRDSSNNVAIKKNKGVKPVTPRKLLPETYDTRKLEIPYQKYFYEPSFGDIEKLPQAKTIIAPFGGSDSRVMHVQASHINFLNVSFYCPFCWTSYRKIDGLPSVRSTKVEHMRNSLGTNVIDQGQLQADCTNPAYKSIINNLKFQIWVTSNTEGNTLKKHDPMGFLLN